MRVRRSIALAFAVGGQGAGTASAEPAPVPSPWKVQVGGYVQADAIVSNQASVNELDTSGAPMNQTRFLIRRARVRLDVARSFVWGAVELDANTVEGIHAGLTEADIGVAWKGEAAREPASARAALGMFKIPFGMEVPERDPDRFFLERTTMSRALFPGSYDLGARADGSFGPLCAVIAVMNGNPTADRFLPARDPNSEKDIIGRLGVETEVTRSVKLRLGFSALEGTGFHPGNPSTKDVLVWRDVNENGRVESTEIQAIAGSAAVPSQNFDRFAVGADLRITADMPWLGALQLSGEVLSASNLDRAVQPADPVSMGRDVQEVGYYVGITQELTQHAMIGLRYDHYGPDTDGAEQRGVALVPLDSSYSTVAIAAAARFPPARLIVEYDFNENALGRSTAGIPTTLASNQLAIRGEVVF